MDLHLADRFKTKFGRQPVIIQSPGRINLIGEHTDYNDGLVMPCAIQYHLKLAIALNDSGRCNCSSSSFGDTVFSIGELVPGNFWINYVMGVIHGFKVSGIAVRGFDLMVEGDLPVGAGLSSSAALCCGLAFGLSNLMQTNFDRLELVRIAQQAEHYFAGVRCGLMDQYTCLFGSKDAAILLDCRSLTHELIELHLGSYTWLLVNSGVHHQLADSAYNKRRESCESGVRFLATRFQISSLRDVTIDMLNSEAAQMDPEAFRRCRYVVEEIARTESAADQLRSGDLIGFGKSMVATHDGLRFQYEVSCDETDFLVELARSSEGVLGARMMGGGFGGCTLNLIHKDRIGEFSSEVRKKYVARFKKEPDFYQVSASDGVKLTN